jgi:hypothetical protein
MKLQTLLLHIRSFAKTVSHANQYLTNIKMSRLLLWPQCGQNGLPHTALCSAPHQHATVLSHSRSSLVALSHRRAAAVPVVRG